MTEILHIEARKEIIFSILNHICGPLCRPTAYRTSTLRLIRAILVGKYGTESRGTNIARLLKNEMPDIYETLTPFFY
jgi:hypothetical protein